MSEQLRTARTAELDWLIDADGAPIGLRDAQGQVHPFLRATLGSDGAVDVPFVDPEGGVHALATAAQAGTALTATGTGYTGACEFWGIEVTAYNGGPQTIVVTDDADGSGDPIATFVVSGVGFYPYSGDWTTPGGGQNLSRQLDTGAYLTISGGTSRTAAAIVTPI